MEVAVGGSLLGSISEFCRRTGMAESTFGRRAVNDGKFVARLRDGARVTPETMFAIGSISKSFTAASVGILVDEGKVVQCGRIRMITSGCLAAVTPCTRQIQCGMTYGNIAIQQINGFG